MEQQRKQIFTLFAWQSEARDEFEVKDRPKGRGPPAATAFAVILVFEFISRTMATMRSMRTWR
jgi:hypothetical protein